jgi:hypothetical protein
MVGREYGQGTFLRLPFALGKLHHGGFRFMFDSLVFL